MNRINVLILGPSSHCEFHDPITQIQKLITQIFGSACFFPNVADIHSSRPNATASHTDVPAQWKLILICQAYPLQFSRTELLQLHVIYPLTPKVILAGTCCEGFLRTCPPPAGFFLLYTHHFDVSILTEIKHFLLNQNSVLSLSSTSELEDIIYEHTGKYISAPAPCTRSCLIVQNFGPLGNDDAMNQLFVDHCHRYGFSVDFYSGKFYNTFPEKVLADADDSRTDQIAKAVQRLKSQFADSEINVYVNSPRTNEKKILLNAGADRILPKLTAW